MTKEDLKAQHTATYNEIIAEGVAAERDRVAAIMVYVDVDAAAVSEMVANGANPTQKFFAEMNRKALANDMLQAAKAETIPAIETKTETTPETKADADVLEFEKIARAAAGLNV